MSIRIDACKSISDFKFSRIAIQPKLFCEVGVRDRLFIAIIYLLFANVTGMVGVVRYFFIYHSQQSH